MPSDEDLGEAYSDYYTHELAEAPKARSKRLQAALIDGYLQRRLGYAGQPGWTWRRLLSLLSFMHPGGHAELAGGVLYLPARHPGARVIDVGCGSGEFLLRMQSLGWAVEGIEPDPAAVAVARSHGIRVTQGDLLTHSYPTESVDAVTMSHVIEHVPDPVSVLRECYRILKRGGRMVVLTPNSNSLGHSWFGSSWYPLEPPRHLLIFNEASMRRAVIAAGIPTFRIKTTVRYARGIWALSRQIRATGKIEKRRATTLRANLGGLPFQLVERLFLNFRRSVGEELLLEVEKQAD